MQYFLSRVFLALLLFAPKVSDAQEVWKLIIAEGYHRMKPGPEKIKAIQELEKNGWFHQDSYFDLSGKPKESPKIDLAPYVDDTGETVFLVTDVAPEFPGGSLVFSDYLQNVVGDLLTKQDEPPQRNLRILFFVEKDGRISEIELVQSPFEWDSKKVIEQRCLQAIQEMPTWSPGRYKEKPVKVKMVVDFSLSE
jgi:hypothetical protein